MTSVPESRLLVAVISLYWIPYLGTADDYVPPEDSSGAFVRVTTILVEPYTMIRWDRRNVTDRQRYEGYVVDLVDKLAQVIGFKYRLAPVADGRYGYLQPDGEWDGMIGELRRKEADIAAAPMYITQQRWQAVDFSTPYMTVHASVLLRRPAPGSQQRIQSAGDLIRQSELQYGTLKTGLIVRAFKTSNDSLERSMWRNMRRFVPGTFTDSNEEGMERVRTQKYAYILPTTIADYVTSRKPCDLISVDKFLMESHYGLAVQKGSGLLSKLNAALDLLETNGYLQLLYDKWWTRRGECNGIKSSKMYSLNTAGNCRLSNMYYLLIHLVWLWFVQLHIYDSTEFTV